MRRLRRYRLLVTLAGLAAAGCQAPADRLNHGNFALIQPGFSTQARVQELLGNPDSRWDELWLYQRPDRHLVVQVDFDETGRVARKQWIDALGDTWDDSAEPPAEGEEGSRGEPTPTP